MRCKARLLGLLITVGVVTVMLVGCSGGSDQLVFQNVSERVSYNPDGTRISFASFGGSGLLYIYSIGSNGGNLLLLTPAGTDATQVNEGGKMPAWAPDGSQIAIVSRRNGSQALFSIDPNQGDRQTIRKITDDTGVGADAQPSWSADSSTIVFASNKRAGVWDIVTIKPNGSDRTDVIATDANEQWPVFSPDGSKIAYQSDEAGTTDIWVLDIAAGTRTNITGPNAFRDEAPSWSADGTIAFHSNRFGNFDILKMAEDGSGLVRLTNDDRSNGFPVFTADGARIAFTRDREIWTMAADGTDVRQVTRRY